MGRLVRNNLDHIAFEDVMEVVEGLRFHGHPAAIALARQLGKSVTLSGALSDDARITLSGLVFEWQATLM
jgi:hypothetical protein